MNKEIRYWFETHEGSKLYCPEDAEVIHQQEFGNWAVLGVIVDHDVFTAKTWVFFNGEFYSHDQVSHEYTDKQQVLELLTSMFWQTVRSYRK